jgi:hypothetical protein
LVLGPYKAVGAWFVPLAADRRGRYRESQLAGQFRNEWRLSPVRLGRVLIEILRKIEKHL